MSGDAAIEIGVLGPLEIRAGGRAIALARPKQRALLAVLALSPGECVSRERLVDELWGGRPPGSAVHALQVHVSGLRKVLGAGVVVTCPGGYKLAAPPDVVDAVRAARLVEAGRRDRDAEALGAALALFRGRPLEDVALEGQAGREAGRLSDLRAEALEERFELALAAGEGASLVAGLERLVADEPLRERPRGQLMRALYRAGRQADALAAFQDARRTFVDELGIEPSPALREIERAILNQDAALAAPRPEAAAAAAPARRRRRLIAAVAVAAPAAAAGVLAAVLLSPSNPGAAPVVRPRERATRSVVVTPVARTTAVVRHERRPGRTARARAVVRHRAARRSVSTPVLAAVHTSPATTTAPPPAPPATTTRPAVPPAPPKTTPKQPAITTHPVATTTTPPGPTRIVDTFDGPSTDAVWNIFLNGQGANVIQQDGKLLLTISPGATPGGAYDFVGAQYGTRSCFSGDIDMQVDYQLLEWPAGSGAYVGLNAVFANAMVERFATPDSPIDSYGSVIDPRFRSVVATGTSGSLRLTRVGGVVTTYYLANGAWQPIDSGEAPNPAHLHIGLALNPGRTTTSEIQVALDNFSATASGEIVQGC